MSLESATWATQLNTNNPQSSDPRSNGDDHLRMIKSVLSNELSPANREWIYTAHSAVWATSTSITIDGDQSGTYPANRRVKVIGASTGTIYGEVSSNTYSASTTVSFRFDSGSLANEALTPYVSLLTNNALPTNLFHLEPTQTEPTSPRNGDIRYADGSGWIPSSGIGKGLYFYDGSIWRPFG